MLLVALPIAEKRGGQQRVGRLMGVLAAHLRGRARHYLRAHPGASRAARWLWQIYSGYNEPDAADGTSKGDFLRRGCSWRVRRAELC